jgi:hypothetical protein
MPKHVLMSEIGIITHRGRPRRWSASEKKMNCVKLLGQRLVARDFDCQVAQLKARLCVLNAHTALGIQPQKL